MFSLVPHLGPVCQYLSCKDHWDPMRFMRNGNQLHLQSWDSTGQKVHRTMMENGERDYPVVGVEKKASQESTGVGGNVADHQSGRGTGMGVILNRSRTGWE